MSRNFKKIIPEIGFCLDRKTSDGISINKKPISKNSINSIKNNTYAGTFPNLILFLSIFLLLITITFAIPDSITLQGKLTNQAGSSQQGTFNFTFRIYDSFTGGNALWELANYNVTTDANGVYDVILPNINLSFADQYYLGITLMSDDESAPRINLTASPYSFRANTSEALNPNASYFVNNLSVNGHATIGNGTSTLEISTQAFNLTTAGSVSLASNITLGSQLMFRFGQAIDNLVNGWLKVTGALNVTGNTSIAQNTLFVDNTSGRVGIGLTSPNDILEVIGNIRVSGSLNATNINASRFYARNGSVSAPSYAFIEDTNTGIMKTSEDNLTLVTGGVSRLTIDSSGNVGIGTTSPATVLDVKGKANFTGNFSIGQTSNIFFVDNTTGNVGIGTTSPNRALTVVGNVNITGFVNITSHLDVRGSSITLGDETTDTLNVNAYIGTDLIPVDNARDVGSSANRWRTGYFDAINANNLSSGNATISGTTADTFTIFSNNSGNDAQDISLAFERGTPVTNAVLKWDFANKAFNMNFPLTIDANQNLTVDTNTLFVDGSVKRVGIGTASPNEALEVIGNVRISGSLNASFINASQMLIGTKYVQTSSDFNLGNISNYTQYQRSSDFNLGNISNASNSALRNGTPANLTNLNVFSLNNTNLALFNKSISLDTYNQSIILDTFNDVVNFLKNVFFYNSVFIRGNLTINQSGELIVNGTIGGTAITDLNTSMRNYVIDSNSSTRSYINANIPTRANISDYLGNTNDTILKKTNDTFFNPFWTRANTTDYLGGINASLLQVGNISNILKDAWTRANTTDYLGGSDVNASILKSTNITSGNMNININNATIQQTNTTIGNFSIIQFNASCAGFRFNTTGGGLFSCMP